MTTWNYRVVRFKEEFEHQGSRQLMEWVEICEVYYENGYPVSYGRASVSAETLPDLQETIDRFLSACAYAPLNEWDINPIRETPQEESKIPVMDDSYFGDCKGCVDW